MNQRNVDALCRIYADAFLKVSWDDINDDLLQYMPLRDAVRRGCARMAAAGVLAPSAMTVKQVEDLTMGFEYGEFHGGDYSPESGHAEMIARLERIAKGEQE
jgi:hypothetical protein